MPTNCIFSNCWSCFIAGQRNSRSCPYSSAYMSLLMPQLVVIDRSQRVSHLSSPVSKAPNFSPLAPSHGCQNISFNHFQQSLNSGQVALDPDVCEAGLHCSWGSTSFIDWFTLRANLESPVYSLTCFWKVRGNPRTRKRPAQAVTWAQDWSEWTQLKFCQISKATDLNLIVLLLWQNYNQRGNFFLAVLPRLW